MGWTRTSGGAFFSGGDLAIQPSVAPRHEFRVILWLGALLCKPGSDRIPAPRGGQAWHGRASHEAIAITAADDARHRSRLWSSGARPSRRHRQPIVAAREIPGQRRLGPDA